MENMSWEDFYRLLKNNISKKPLLLIGLFINVISAFLLVLIPILIGNIVNQGNIGLDNILNLILLFIVTFALQGIGTWVLGFVSIDLIKNIRMKLYEHIIKLPLFDIKTLQVGEFSSLITNDVSKLSAVIYQSFPQIVMGIISFIGSLIMLFFINFKLTSMTLILIPILAVILIPIGIKMEKISTDTQKQLGKVSGYVTQKMENIKLIKSFLGEDQEIESGRILITKLSNTSLKNITLLAITQPLISFLLITFVMFVLFNGARDVANGVMSVGSLTTFVIYIFQLVQVIEDFSSVFSEIAQAKGSSSKINEIFQIKTENLDHGISKEIVDGKIEFRDVTFGYHNFPVLKNISFSVKPKTLTAIVGPSGAGKSTMFSLISKYYTNYTGEILIDGENLENISKKSIRNQISYVSQTHSMFSGSILENLKYGKNQSLKSVDTKLILQKSGLDFIEKMPKKINSVLGENGEGLSEGEKQRLSIARSIAGNPKILLLDEITSSLDHKSESLITSTIKDISRNISVVIIAHRLETIIHADIIYVLNDEGKIEAQGTHSELIHSNELYNAYFKNLNN